MRVNCNFNFEAWIKNVVIDDVADEDEALERLRGMTLEEIVDAGGYAAEDQITEIETEIIEATYQVKVSSIDYDITEADIDFPTGDVSETIAKLKAKLPQELFVEINYDANYSDNIDELVSDAVSDETGFFVNSCEYEIIKIS